MGLEIERKFLLRTDSWRTLSTKAISIQQGYLCVEPARTVRVRTWNNDGKITVKGASHNGIRKEFEYSIPVQEAKEMIRDLCLPGIIHKTRHIICIDDVVWEVDEFHDHNSGLIIAEIELESLDQQFSVPSWIGIEVTNDHRFHNSHLSNNIIDWSDLHLE